MGNTQPSPKDDKEEQEATDRSILKKADNQSKNKQLWRQLEKGGCWTDENYEAKLMADIVNNQVSIGEIEEINILLVGPIQSGKSSFINSVASIDTGRIAMASKVDKSGVKSLTKKLKCLKPTEKFKNLVLFDTMGVEKEDLNGLSIKDFMYIVNGNVYPNYKFDPSSPIKEDNDFFNSNPSDKDKMHCVVFVVDANIIGQDNMPLGTRNKLNKFQEALDDYDILQMVLLTKIDVLSKEIDTDIAETYKDVSVKNAVELAEHVFGISKACIWPVKNYSDNVNTDTGIEISILLALRQMIFFASDFLKNHGTYQKKSV